MRRSQLLATLVGFAACFVGCKKSPILPPGSMLPDALPVASPTFTVAWATAGLAPGDGVYATISFISKRRDAGALYCQLFPDRAPLAVATFVGLARGIRPFAAKAPGRWQTEPYFRGVDYGTGVFSLTGPTTESPEGAWLGFALPSEHASSARVDRPGLLVLRGDPSGMIRRVTFYLAGTPPDPHDDDVVLGACGPLATVARIYAKMSLEIGSVSISLNRPPELEPALLAGAACDVAPSGDGSTVPLAGPFASLDDYCDRCAFGVEPRQGCGPKAPLGPLAGPTHLATSAPFVSVHLFNAPDYAWIGSDLRLTVQTSAGFFVSQPFAAVTIDELSLQAATGAPPTIVLRYTSGAQPGAAPTQVSHTLDVVLDASGTPVASAAQVR